MRAQSLYGSEPQRLHLLVSHEYVHQAVSEISFGNCPRWLEEGLALSFSQELPESYTESLATAVQEARTFPLEALGGDELFDIAPETTCLVYSQSHSLVDYLVQKIGWEGMAHLVRLCRNNETDRALQEFSLNCYLLEREWLRWLHN